MNGLPEAPATENSPGSIHSDSPRIALPLRQATVKASTNITKGFRLQYPNPPQSAHQPLGLRLGWTHEREESPP